MRGNASDGYALDLRAGNLVEIRSEREILATLGETGAVDALPFVPEMLALAPGPAPGPPDDRRAHREHLPGP